MKISGLFLVLALALAALAGCARSSAKSAAAPAAPVPAAHYKAGHGLRLTPTASRFIGLQTAETETRDVGAAKGVTAVPAAALLRTVKGDFVFVANGGWFLRTPVKLGAGDGAWFEVRDGLYDGDTVVTQGTAVLWLAELQAVNGGVGCADGH